MITKVVMVIGARRAEAPQHTTCGGGARLSNHRRRPRIADMRLSFDKLRMTK